LRFPKAEFFYADEEVVQKDAVVAFAKPEFGPHSLLGDYLIGGVCAVSPSLLTKLSACTLHSIDEITLEATQATKHIKRIPIPLSKRKMLSEEQLRQWQKRVMKQMHIAGDIIADARSGMWKPSLILPEQQPLVSIIIPTKNAIDILKQCLISIFSLTNYSNLEVIVLDNNSDNPRFFEEINLLQQQHPNLSCVAIPTPFNFSRLMNAGAKLAQGEYIVLLNNDVEIISPDWLKDMVAMALVKQTGVVGAKLLYPNETIQHAGIAVSAGDTVAHHVFAHKPRYDAALCNSILSIRNYSALTAACILVSKKIYAEAGGFDEQFAVEYNDIDFCLNVQQLGYYNVYLPYVELFHYESISRGHPHSTKTALERSRKETALFQQKWNTIIADDPNWHPALAFIPQLAD
jgi:GT2 family glycosyltransferase